MTTDSPAGLLLKVNPPIRDKHHNQALWQGVEDGRVQCMGSDHVVTNFFEKMVRGDTGDREGDLATSVWETGSGFVGMEILLPLMLSEGVNAGRIPLERVVEICCENPAKAFGLYPKKGSLMVGADADLVILDLDKEVAFSGERFHGFGDFTLFDGWNIKGWPKATISRGKVVFEEGQVTGTPGQGRYLPRKPDRPTYPVEETWDLPK
jgi:dihydropyrimidinase